MMKRKVFLIGGFNKTKYLANSLIHKGYSVTAINDDQEKCHLLAENEKLIVFHGDGSKPYVLEDADAYDADIAIALTDRDDDNLVICELCKAKFRVKKTVAVITDPQKIDFYYRMGIDSVVCSVVTIASVIEQQAFLDEMATVVPIGPGQMSITQVPISGASHSVGKEVSKLNLPDQVIVGCLMRGDKSMIPRSDTQILAGDILILISADGHEAAAVRELTKQ